MSNLLHIVNWLSERDIDYAIIKGKSDILHIKEDIGRRLDPVIENEKVNFKRSHGNVFVSYGDKIGFDNYISESLRKSTKANKSAVDNPLNEILSERRSVKTKLSKVLGEALEGIAAEHQPQELLQSLNKAMLKLGLPQKLKNVNVTGKVSYDKQFITFIKDVNGESIQLMQIATEQLAEPRFMSSLLSSLMDVADAKAPGSGENQRNVIKNREKLVNNIAKQYVVQKQQPEY